MIYSLIDNYIPINVKHHLIDSKIQLTEIINNKIRQYIAHMYKDILIYILLSLPNKTNILLFLKFTIFNI